jgi:hypothetical protein
MKTTRLAATLACLMVAFCARAPQEKSAFQNSELSPTASVIAQETIAYDNVTADALWAACKKTLSDMKVPEYRGNNAEKRILAVIPKTIASYEFADYTKREPDREPEVIKQKAETNVQFYLLLKVDEGTEGSVLIAKIAGGKIAPSRGEGVLKNFLGQLAKNLKK